MATTVTVDDLVRINRASDPRNLRKLSYEMMRGRILTGDWSTLENESRELVFKTHPRQYADQILSISIDDYARELKAALADSISIANEKGASALYYEWERSALCSEIFVCQAFDINDVDWARNVLLSIEGPNIEFSFPEFIEEELLTYEQAKAAGIWGVDQTMGALQSGNSEETAIIGEPIFSAYDEEIVEIYFNALFFTNLGRAWEIHGSAGITLGAAEHDNEILLYEMVNK